MHVTCMFHANFINLHEQQHNMHAIMLMYKHVSRNMQESRTFSMHVICIKYDMHLLYKAENPSAHLSTFEVMG